MIKNHYKGDIFDSFSFKMIFSVLFETWLSNFNLMYFAILLQVSLLVIFGLFFVCVTVMVIYYVLQGDKFFCDLPHLLKLLKKILFIYLVMWQLSKLDLNVYLLCGLSVSQECVIFNMNILFNFIRLLFSLIFLDSSYYSLLVIKFSLFNI